MKKFKSFKSSEPVKKEQENKVKVKETKDSDKSVNEVKRRYKEDPSFGKRLNFTLTDDKSKLCEKTAETTVISNKVSDNVYDDEAAKNKIVEYNRKLRKNPNDVNLWLEFVNFQDELVELKNKRKVIERKIAILKKAIELNFDLKLILEHLRLAGEIEESSTLMRLWEGYLKKIRDSDANDLFVISMEYLNFRQKRFLAFNFEQVNEAFSDVFKLVKRSEKVQLSSLNPLYLNYFKFLKRGGYNERIIALFQVLIELNIEKFNYGQVDLEAYEDQYERMDHIGDTLIDNVIVQSATDIEFSNYCSQSFLLKWIELEKYRELLFWHPKNSFDLEGQVIFDDLKDFIIILDSRDDILPFIKAIVFELATAFSDCPFGFHQWYVKVLKTLLPFYKNDWEFVLNLFKTLNPNEADSFAKSLLSKNRESLEIFFAYGRFQEFLGNHQMASKVFESLRKRTFKFNELKDAEAKVVYEKPPPLAKLEFKNVKEEVYDLVRLNPGDKDLYMRIIEAVEPLDHELAMEIFNLIDEQQLRLLSFLEEV